MQSILTSIFSLVLCLTLSAQIPTYVPTDGLVGWWPFNGNANDESGNGNHGVVNGATLAEDRFGQLTSAMNFDGIDDDITIQNSPELMILGDITMSAWVRTEGYDQVHNYQTVISKRQQDYSWQYAMGISYHFPNSHATKFITSRGNGPGNQDQVWSVTPVETNQWEHWTCVYEGNEIRIYRNGILDTFGFNDVVTPVQDGVLLFGRSHTWNTAEQFLGSIDDIAIYNRALTPAEITQLYTAAEEPVATCTPLAPNLQNGLVGYWPFCGNANDESGNGNDGVVNGATLAEDRFGNVNSCYYFNNNHIQLPSEFGFTSPTGEFTTSIWFNSNFTTNPQQFFLDLRFGNQVRIVLDEFNTLDFNVEGPMGGGWVNGPANTDYIGEWTHMVGVVRQDSLFLYLNGQLVNSNSANNIFSVPFNAESGICNSCGNEIYRSIGATDNLYPNQFTIGSLDDIAIYNRALTPAEIAQLYTGAAAPCNLIASETQDTPVEVGGSAQMYVTLNATDNSMQWQTNAAGLGWMDVQDNNTYTGSQTQNLLISNATLANHEQPFRIIVTDGICNDTSDVALLLVNNTCTAYDTITTTVEVFDTLTIENVVEVYDTLTIYNTIDIFDTTSVTVEVFDTITNVVDVFDTTTIYLQVDIFDTLFIDVYDTTYVQQTIDVYDTTYVTLTDTTYIQVIDTAYVTVTDTLLIDITFVGFEGQPSWLNTVLVYPNPASDYITIDYGNFELMAGYNTIITDAAGATVYSGAVNSQQATIDINAWGAAGVYFMSVYNASGSVVAVRQIVLE
ncbi:MAG: LamG-like jellyroll fold domain-containing protein [Flavobacteriales bacterium]